MIMTFLLFVSMSGKENSPTLSSSKRKEAPDVPLEKNERPGGDWGGRKAPNSDFSPRGGHLPPVAENRQSGARGIGAALQLGRIGRINRTLIRIKRRGKGNSPKLDLDLRRVGGKLSLDVYRDGEWKRKGSSFFSRRKARVRSLSGQNALGEKEEGPPRIYPNAPISKKREPVFRL